MTGDTDAKAKAKTVQLYTATTCELPLLENIKARSTKLDDISDSRTREVARDQRKEGVSRLSCWFACDKPELAALFLMGERKHGRDKDKRKGDVLLIYAVEMDAPSKHPMCLVDAIAKNLEKNNRILSSLAGEYWKPTRDWRFFEYLSSEIRVMTQVPWPTAPKLGAVSISHSTDVAAASSFVQSLIAHSTPSSNLGA